MDKPKSILGVALILLVIPALIAAGWGLGHSRFAIQPVQAGQIEEFPAQQVDSPDTGDPLVLSYSVKFVCTESLQPGQHFIGRVAPIVQQKTEILIHNPHDFSAVLFKKAVIASLEGSEPVDPGHWYPLRIDPDYAVRIDCDDITRLLTGDPNETFLHKFGIGKTVEGFVVIGIGPQEVAGTAGLRYAPLDVTAEYVRSSEVLKKDISYQPWWRWWWWPLPWRLGYPYERIVHYNQFYNIDCRELLIGTLHSDIDQSQMDPNLAAQTHQALETGFQLDPTNLPNEAVPPALVPLIGRCDKLDTSNLAIDYVLVSNKGPSDPNPLTPTSQPEQVLYPWIPGRWYDLPVVMPENVTIDLDRHMVDWHSQLWIEAGALDTDVQLWMPYFFPYWCGWGYWWPWWNGSDCTDIGVGEGESLDVEQVNPTRVFMTVWPPIVPGQ